MEERIKEIKAAIIKEIGTYNNDLVDSIAESCAKVAVSFFSPPITSSLTEGEINDFIKDLGWLDLDCSEVSDMKKVANFVKEKCLSLIQADSIEFGRFLRENYEVSDDNSTSWYYYSNSENTIRKEKLSEKQLYAGPYQEYLKSIKNKE